MDQALPGQPKLRAAYGFDSANTEVVFIVGPILVTALATGIDPEAGLSAVVICAVAGTLALAGQRSTQPDPAGPGARRTASALRFPALRAIYLTRFCLGGVLGAVPIVTVAYATAQHGRGYSGLLLGACGTASMVGGLIYGTAGMTMPLPRRLLVTVLLFALGFIPLLFVSGIVSLALLLLVAGLAMAPIAARRADRSLNSAVLARRRVRWCPFWPCVPRRPTAGGSQRTGPHSGRGPQQGGHSGPGAAQARPTAAEGRPTAAGAQRGGHSRAAQARPREAGAQSPAPSSSMAVASTAMAVRNSAISRYSLSL